MDLTPSSTPDTQTPPPAPPTNGTLKRHHPSTASAPSPPPSTVVVSYKECLKNHAATIGGHALDGCCEFLPISSADPTQPESLMCAACGCHRNFHRQQDTQQLPSNPNFINFYHHSPPPPPPPPPRHGPSLSPSPSPPPPQITHHFPPPRNMVLSFGNAVFPSETNNNQKRFRTKFSQEQKEKMFTFAEKLGWKLHKPDEALVQEFCNDIGVSKNVFKVWMHNNKNTFKKVSSSPEFGNANANARNDDDKNNGDGGSGSGFNGDINNP